MAFLVPLSLAGLSYLIDGKSRSKVTYQPSGAKLGGSKGRPPISSNITAAHIKQAPAYTLPSLGFLEADDQRIADQLVLVEASAEAYEERNAQKQASDPEVKKLLKIVTDFIKDRGLVVYGGT
jgi:hypothetical protein